jgi:DNA-binding transcriptional regulator YiaG
MTPTDARRKLGLSVEEMALAMGVHRQTLVKWERGEREPDNAAKRLMELLCWLHDNRGPTLAQWLRGI